MATSSAANPQNLHHRAHRVNLARHAARCRVCNHPSRLAIEFDFLNWRNPFDLAQSYGLLNISSIYRHAHATGLFGRRRLNIRFALERMVERVGEVPVTASAILRSVHAITRINDAGEWVDPPSRVIISREDSPESPKSSRHNSPRANRESNPPAATIFEPALLDEVSPNEAAHGEQHPEVAKRAAEKLRKAPKAPPPPAIYTIEVSPEFAAAIEERERGLEADRRALEAKNLALAAAHASQSSIANGAQCPAQRKG